MKINAADNAPLMSEWTFPEHPAFCSKAGITAAEEQFCPSAFFCMTGMPRRPGGNHAVQKSFCTHEKPWRNALLSCIIVTGIILRDRKERD